MRYDLFGATLVLFFLFNLFSFSFSGEAFSDKTILLEVKKRVSDASGILSSWDPNSLDHCSWFGVSCDSKSRVVSVNIEGCDDYPGKLVPSSSSLKLSRLRFLGVGRTCSRGRGKLVGQISPLIGKLTELRVLSLAFNDLSGEIPEEIWGLEKLEVLDLQGNNLTARFPETASGLRNLRVLNLGSNRITGEIPLFLLNSANLEFLNLAGNLLKDSNPNLSKNQPKGLTPTQIKRNCRNLQHLELSGNNIKSLEISGNRFRGRDAFLSHASKTLLRTRKLMAINDEDEGSQSNTYLNIDGETEKTHSPGNGLYPIEIASIASASIIVAVLIVLIVLFLYIRKWKQTAKVEVAENREIKVFLDIGVPLTYENIVRATGNFSNGHCIGHGGFGSTYKAQVSQNILLAVKRLSVGRFQGVQQFNAEIMTLEMVRHPNLVTLIGYHASEMEMFLVYNYLPGGNLEDFIKERSDKAVDWKIIHKISLDVARALAYLHDQCSPKVLHRDVKPSNILLDKNLNAYLSDFGLSKLLGTSQTHATTGVAGTFGYVAPEYAMTCRVSEKADVYSYGVVLLELLSDKKALDPSFSSQENGFNIVSWALMMLKRGQAKDVFTQGLWESGPHDDLVEVLHLALKCTVDSLSSRPTMKQVVQQLKQIRP